MVEIRRILEDGMRSGDLTAFARVLVESSQSGVDGRWMLRFCQQVSYHQSEDVAMLGLTCIGHLARTCDPFETDEAVSFLLRRSAEAPRLAGVASDALGDIRVFRKVSKEGDRNECEVR